VSHHRHRVPVGVEGRGAWLHRHRNNLREVDAAELRAGRDVVEQVRDFVRGRHQAAQQRQARAVVVQLLPQVLRGPVREFLPGAVDLRLEKRERVLRRGDLFALRVDAGESDA